ncbi:hypothetical protein IV55_GL001441 [Furfurilactobacillus siliginis]|uniref:DUF3781 domain-containing protein n=2 Tax=Furfurilactobacillus siliginis TaxID=348151 RepID=A0A0R2L9I7_9LACO|nr:hypothetical protein IV55_GL001441 [Furfurilactobacillus siliginis]GEK28898.1 hypothetical protein LSI01_12090 [Furfurilactobacillus siliginis]
MLCYTPLVFERINKKLQQKMTISEATAFVHFAVLTADELVTRGKNIYAANYRQHVCVTVNKHNHRVITVTQLTT